MPKRHAAHVLLGLGWLIFSGYLASRTIADYRMALAAGNLEIGSASAWREIIPFEVFMTVIASLVGVLALLGLGPFPLGVGGAVLVLATLIIGLLPCHGCASTSFLSSVVFAFKLGLGGASVAYCIAEWRKPSE